MPPCFPRVHLNKPADFKAFHSDGAKGKIEFCQHVLNAIYRFFETNNIIEVMQTEVINTSIGRLSTVPFLFYM